MTTMSVCASMVDRRKNPAVISAAPVTRKRFHRPNRVIRAPETVAASIEPMIIGRVSRPAAVGE